MGDFRPHARFSPSADAIYVYLSDQPVAYTRELDDHRLIDYSTGGAVVGVEFLGISGGIDLKDMPLSPHDIRLVQKVLAHALHRHHPDLPRT
jgi:uncharacterized protein YuzE